MTGPLRFLLDQQFPAAPFDVHTLDRSVEYVRLVDFSAPHAASSTPDWMLHLLAAEGGFDGLVTLDRSQLDEDAELVALAQSKISLVTWSGGDEDPVVLWGQLLAYMPQVVGIMATIRPVVVTLPNPRLVAGRHVEKPSDMIKARKQRDKVSYNERRDAAVALMRSELEERGEPHLARHLEKGRGPSSTRRARRAASAGGQSSAATSPMDSPGSA